MVSKLRLVSARGTFLTDMPRTRPHVWLVGKELTFERRGFRRGALSKRVADLAAVLLVRGTSAPRLIYCTACLGG
jgi:hypothetical protein